MISPHDVSIVIPLAHDEKTWPHLAKGLRTCGQGMEIIFVGPQRPEGLDLGTFQESKLGRASQLNLGAKKASRDFLWFVHADSEISGHAVAALLSSLNKNPGALWYFNLRFQCDGLRLMKINEKGVWLRSHLLKMPFGDQGFCVSKALFLNAGGYLENVAYGEDHLLVWNLRRLGVPVLCTGQEIKTSSRKYRDRGWAKTTLLTMTLTAKQALPQWVNLIKRRLTHR